MDWDLALRIAQILSPVVSASAAGAVWLIGRTVASKDDVRAAHHRLDILDERLKGFPGYEVTNELGGGLSQLNASNEAMKTEIRAIDDKVERIDSAVQRIEQHLLSQVSRM